MRLRTLLLGVLSLTLPAAAGTMSVYLSAPGTQSTFVAGALTSDFNSAPLGINTSTLTTNIGYYLASPSAPMAILAADQYGGAGGSQYMSVGAQSGSSSPVTLQLTTSYNYFGFWWSAGDSNNGISLYSGSTLLTRLSTADIVNFFNNAPGNKVTAVDGTKYKTSFYDGNPNNNQNNAEPYAYVNLILTGSVFDRVVFDNSNSSATGFESDNHSVYLGNLTIPNASVFVENIPSTSTSVPEPATYALVGVSFLAAGLVRRRRRC